MQLNGIPFGTTTWADIEPTRHRGESGFALWRTPPVIPAKAGISP
jgi:hypothetical protein